MAQQDVSVDEGIAMHGTAMHGTAMHGTATHDKTKINKLLPPDYFTTKHLLVENQTNTLLKQLEADGMAKVQDLKNNNGTINDVENILANGTAAFEKAKGRPMTYAEIRAAYG